MFGSGSVLQLDVADPFQSERLEVARLEYVLPVTLISVVEPNGTRMRISPAFCKVAALSFEDVARRVRTTEGQLATGDGGRPAIGPLFQLGPRRTSGSRAR